MSRAPKDESNLPALFDDVYHKVNQLIPYSVNRKGRNQQEKQKPHSHLNLAATDFSPRGLLVLMAMRRRLDKPFSTYRFDDPTYTEERFLFDQSMVSAICDLDLHPDNQSPQEGVLPTTSRTLQLPNFHFKYPLHRFGFKEYPLLKELVRSNRGNYKLSENLKDYISSSLKYYKASQSVYLSFNRQQTRSLYYFLSMHPNAKARTLSLYMMRELTVADIFLWLFNLPIPIQRSLLRSDNVEAKKSIIQKSMQRAIEFQMGNCYELACAVAQLLMESKACQSKSHIIQFIDANPVDDNESDGHQFIKVRDKTTGKEFIIDPWAGLCGLLSDYPNLTEQLPYQMILFQAHIGSEDGRAIHFESRDHEYKDHFKLQNTEPHDFFKILMFGLNIQAPLIEGDEEVKVHTRSCTLSQCYIDYMKTMALHEVLTLLLHAYAVENEHHQSKHKQDQQPSYFWLCKLILENRDDVSDLLCDNNCVLVDDAKHCAEALTQLEMIVLPLLVQAANATEKQRSSQGQYVNVFKQSHRAQRAQAEQDHQVTHDADWRLMASLLDPCQSVLC